MASDRLNRLLRLRSIKAPSWIIKHEQVKLVMERYGHLHSKSAKFKIESDLFEEYVAPLMG